MDPVATTNHSNQPVSTPPPDRLRIVTTPGIRGGRPRIDGHRITVDDIAIWHERLGMSPDEIVGAHPTITLSEIHAALAYYFEHKSQVDAAIEESERFVAQMKAHCREASFRPGLLRACSAGLAVFCPTSRQDLFADGLRIVPADA